MNTNTNMNPASCARFAHMDSMSSGPNYCARFAFPNGYGASVVCHYGSYGGQEGLFEVALTRGAEGPLVYRDDFANGDVMGHLNFHQVAGVLDQIAALDQPVGSAATPEPDESDGLSPKLRLIGDKLWVETLKGNYEFYLPDCREHELRAWLVEHLEELAEDVARHLCQERPWRKG